MTKTNWFKIFSLSTIWTWITVFCVFPLSLIIVTSFLSHSEDSLVIMKFTSNEYLQLSHPLYFKILLQSLSLAAIVTFICLLLGYPTAFFMARTAPKYQNILLLLMIIPFWTSSLIRTYAILAILKTKGLLNSFLLWLGIIHHPLQLLYSNLAVIIGASYDLLPFMILPLFANIEKLDPVLLEAAQDLGASKIKTLWSIIIPLTVPGILAGVLLVFLPSITLFYIPVLLGGAKSLLIGNLIETQFLFLHNWPGGCATSIVLTIVMLVLMAFYRRYSSNRDMQELL